MSAIVDFEYYSTVYMGTEADEASFPALCARAEDVIGAMVRWQDPAAFTPFQLTLYKKAVCAQVDFFAVNGLDSVAGGTDKGFTVGKVSISGKSGSDLARKGSMADSLSNLVLMYLEQSGLLNPAVPVVGGCVC
jgi:hypothetical protein